MVFHHRDDRTLIDREVGSGIPIATFAKRVDKTEAPPHAVSGLGEEAAQCVHGLCRREGNARQRGARRNHAQIPVGRMRSIASRPMTCGQTPAIGTIAEVAVGIEDTMSVIDLRVPNVLVPIIGVTIDEAARIKPAEGIVGKEERTAEIHPKRQGDVVIIAAISKAGTSCKALVIDLRIDGVLRRSRRQYETEQAFVPTLNWTVHRPAMVRAPVPHELPVAACEPGPFGLRQERIHASFKTMLSGGILGKILASANQPLEQERRLDQVGAVIFSPEGNGLACPAVDEVRKHAVVTLRTFQEIEHSMQPAQRCAAIDPTPIDRNDNGHDAEARAADRHEIIGGVARRLLAIPGKSANGMRAFPEIAGRLPLHDVEQCLVIKVGGVRGETGCGW